MLDSSDKVQLSIVRLHIFQFLTFVSVKILFLSEHVEEELLAGAALHARGVSLVEQDCGHPGQQERHPASQHDHPHLVNIVKL